MLRPILRYHASSSGNGNGNDDADAIPKRARLVPDEVARMAAHTSFLSLPDPSKPVEESELLERWSSRLPSIPGGYEPRVGLLRGIAVSEVTKGDDGGEGETTRRRRRWWRYLPESALPTTGDAGARIEGMFAFRRAWTAEEAAPYLRRLLLAVGRGGGDGGEEEERVVRELLGKHSRTIRVSEKDGEGKEAMLTKYVAKPK